jgi:hypothetical protein
MWAEKKRNDDDDKRTLYTDPPTGYFASISASLIALHEKAEGDFLETVCLRSALLLLLFATLEESAEEEEAIKLNAILRFTSFVLYYMFVCCFVCVIMK